MEPILLNAAEREAGALCPHCGVEVMLGDSVAKCRTCGRVQHVKCWDENGCGAYSCAPARRQFDLATPPPQVWKISPDELRRITPMPSRPAAVGGGYRAPQFPMVIKTSGLAIASLVCAIAGIPLYGIITGLVAVVLAAMALHDISNKRRKGKALAYTGLFLGLADAAAWLVLLIHLVNGSGIIGGRSSGPRAIDFKLDPKQIDALPVALSRAMRANVLLTSRHAFGSEIGSGIILRMAGGQAQILTNRHVIDPDFKGSTEPDLSSMNAVEVTLIDQSRSQGRVAWIAPGGVDLAVVTAPCVSTAARSTAWPATRPSIIGDSVFAIGNPQQWGWSQTLGSVSQFRTLTVGGRDLSIIQSGAPINPGNSGGGLYDRDGFLIGVNTWTNDKSVSENLSFSIALDVFLDLSPAEYKPDLRVAPQPPREVNKP